MWFATTCGTNLTSNFYNMKRVYLYNGKPVCLGFEDECEAEPLETFNGFALFPAEEYDGIGLLAVDESEYVEPCEIVLEECENPKSEQHAICLGFFTKEYADEYNFFTKRIKNK